MNQGNTKIILLIAGLFVGAGVLLYVFTKPRTEPVSTSTQTPTTMMEDKTETTTEEDGNGAVLSDQYVEFKTGVLDANQSQRRVLFFYANWCPTCRPVDAELTKNVNDIPEDMVVIRVNYNDDETDSGEEALATQYGVTYQHTFVQIDTNGNEVTKWNGGGLQDIINKVK